MNPAGRGAKGKAKYLVYLPSGGKATVDLSAASGPFAVEWFNPGTGKAKTAAAIVVGASRELTAPFDGDAVLHVWTKGASR